MQHELLPLDIVKLEPALIPSVDILGIGSAIDGHQYVLKSVTKRPDLPATEWICSRLAEEIHIAVPPVRIVKGLDGELLFGSRWEGGIQDQYNTGILTSRLPLARGDELFSAIYAFDLFIHNVDRHAGNYIFRDQNGAVVALAIDFSRALFFHGWPLPTPPVPNDSNTADAYRQIQLHYPFNLAEAESVLLRLAKLSQNQFSGILSAMDSSWLGNAQKQNMLDWWKSSQRKRRLVTIRKGLRNGQYL